MSEAPKKSIDARRVTAPARELPRRPPAQRPQEPIRPEDNPVMPLPAHPEDVPEDMIVHRSFRMSKRVADGFSAFFASLPKEWSQNQKLEHLLIRTGNLAPSQSLPGHGAPPRLFLSTRPLYSERQPVPRRGKNQ